MISLETDKPQTKTNLVNISVNTREIKFINKSNSILPIKLIVKLQISYN